ncbi:DUF6527 family protein [Rhizobium phaseoli]|uniref:DUF6527 family protein n=1 Tax=Rhizobium phaseoli TaxID=396 RepID=UPI0007EA1388|nr:DUF6527 family protein [Rhizobium phaseoli]ANL39261.1 hypothetical protein AMC88_CH00828 [Rhizobium phaseoli]ANL58250.1 hypothetical protein AMC85_CH00828 [Rhizobium phaseoli]
MTRIDQIRPEFVEFIPAHLSPGVLYISKRYSTASHLCCCGCGLEVVTPLNPAKWRLVESGVAASLSPSVGNWSFPCRSHYWITGNQVRWAAAMSAEKIVAVKARDRRDVEAMVPQPRRLFVRFIDAVAAKVAGWFRG